MIKKIIIFGVVILFLIPFNTSATTQNVINNQEQTNFNDINTLNIVDLLNQINEDLLKKYLTELVNIGPRPTGSENCDIAAQYIYNKFEKMSNSLDVEYLEWKERSRAFKPIPHYRRLEGRNVIATLNGTDKKSNAIFIICAHYDTTENSPGANDDGSGVASMLAIASIFSQYSFNHTIRFIAFSGEEVGTCGSHAYAKKAYAAGENIRGVLNLETFGYTSAGGKELFILKTARTEWISQFSQEITDKYYQYINLNLISIGNRPCDHQAFLDYGYDAVQYVQLNRDDYPIHTPEDSLDKINYSYLVNVTRLIFAITAELANNPIDLQIRIIKPYENYFYLINIPIIKLPGVNFFDTEFRGMTYIYGKTIVKVNITSKSEIKSVFFCIDDISEYSGECKEPSYEWEIERTKGWRKYPLKGKHTIGVYVWTIDGKVAYDEMDIFVLKKI
jgi:hypothetical protein